MVVLYGDYKELMYMCKFAHPHYNNLYLGISMVVAVWLRR